MRNGVPESSVAYVQGEAGISGRSGRVLTLFRINPVQINESISFRLWRRP